MTTEITNFNAPLLKARLNHFSVCHSLSFFSHAQSLLTGNGSANNNRTSPGSIGLETEFNNDTDEKQTYTFQFEKVRTATTEVSYQRGYSIGAKANFSVGLPKVLGDGSIGMEFDKRLEVRDKCVCVGVCV